MSEKIFGYDFGTESIRIYLNGEKVGEFPGFDKNRNYHLVDGGKILHFYEIETQLIKVIREYEKVYLGFWRIMKASGLAMIPTEWDEVNMRAYRDMMEFVGNMPAYMIYDHFVASAGLGIDLNGTYIIVNGGAGKTRMSSIRGGEFNNNCNSASIDIAGNSFNETISFNLSRKYSIKLSRETVEAVKKEYGNLKADAPVRHIVMKGTDKRTGAPLEVTVSSDELNSWLVEEARLVCAKIEQFYELLSPEDQRESCETGIHLVGKNFRLPGFVELIASTLPVSAQSYQLTRNYMEEGLLHILANMEKYKLYMLQ